MIFIIRNLFQTGGAVLPFHPVFLKITYRVLVHLVQKGRCIGPSSNMAAFYIHRVDIDRLRKDQHNDIEKYQHSVVRIDPNYDMDSADRAFLLYKNHLSKTVHIRLDTRRYAKKITVTCNTFQQSI